MSMLGITMWPTTGCDNFGDAINDMVEHFKDLLSNGDCKIDEVLHEWRTLKTFLLPLYANNKTLSYLELWKTILREC